MRPCHFFIRRDSKTLLPASKAFKWLEPNELLEGTTHPQFAEDWAMADASTFDPIRAA